ncbi:UNVERIFIED_CONTAM: Geranylgeranyl pyrophosphate synthase [Siphonaria sp. JEL0065]|nr:Geranylgeranyl pyrophosphate synthase [Siphonaria sp. JEL0065]
MNTSGTPVAIASVTAIQASKSSITLTKEDLESPPNEIQQQRILLEPFVYLTQNRGKEIRSKLVHAFDQWLKVPEEKLKVISEIIEMLHTASLLIDDVEDGSDLRRGLPVAHKIYGVASAINSGNYVYFLALKKAISLEIPSIMEIFADELIHLHTGQGMEIYWRDNNICPTEKEYLQMISNKTGGLLRLAVRMMQAASTQGGMRDFVPLVDMLGIHFQIRDDYLNLVSEEFTSNKGYAEDLTEGKFSYPVILHIQQTHALTNPSYTQQTQLTVPNVTDPQSRQIFQILKQRTHDVDLKKYAIGAMKSSLEKVKVELVRLEEVARREIRVCGGNRELEQIVEFLSKAYRG